MIVYVRDVDVSLRFYRDLLGFQPIEAMEGYARLRSARGEATIALHATRDRKSSRGTKQVALYFETRSLHRVCRRLVRRGVRF